MGGHEDGRTGGLMGGQRSLEDTSTEKEASFLSQAVSKPTGWLKSGLLWKESTRRLKVISAPFVAAGAGAGRWGPGEPGPGERVNGPARGGRARLGSARLGWRSPEHLGGCGGGAARGCGDAQGERGLRAGRPGEPLAGVGVRGGLGLEPLSGRPSRGAAGAPTPRALRAGAEPGRRGRRRAGNPRWTAREVPAAAPALLLGWPRPRGLRPEGHPSARVPSSRKRGRAAPSLPAAWGWRADGMLIVKAQLHVAGPPQAR